MKKLSVIFILLLLLHSPSKAQQAGSGQQSETKPFVLGSVEEIWSDQLSEKRVLNIYLPEGYDTATGKTYPVIYLLDGSANEDFIHITGIVQFLTMTGDMPQTIVVGIANVDRRRDLTFPTSVARDKKDYPTTGGSEKFMSFIEKELEPFVQKKYRVNESRALIGQSLGGLFATEVLLKKPGLFDTYIIVSPSLWWDNESLLAKAPTLLKSDAGRNITVYISVGSGEEKVMQDDARKLADILQHANPNFNVLFSTEPDENHLTILHNSIYKALKKLNSKK